MKNTELVLKYAMFACVAISFNIFSQYVSLNLYKGIFDIYVAIFFGTAAGLLIKYFLDKKYIFYYQPQNQIQNFGKFIIYTGTGVITTIIFWGSELLFNHLFTFGAAKFIGALIGLSIGYYIKYNLDKKFVFIKEKQTNE